MNEMRLSIKGKKYKNMAEILELSKAIEKIHTRCYIRRLDKIREISANWSFEMTKSEEKNSDEQ
jgi:hypothetical protein